MAAARAVAAHLGAAGLRRARRRRRRRVPRRRGLAARLRRACGEGRRVRSPARLPGVAARTKPPALPGGAHAQVPVRPLVRVPPSAGARLVASAARDKSQRA